MTILYQLAEDYQTDKRQAEHNYVMMYDKLLERERLRAKNVLEIGFGNGASVKMWKDYFTNAKISCIEYAGCEENKTVWKSPDLVIPDVTVYTGDSTEPEVWNKIPNNFDYIIDDGSHFPKDQMKTFFLAFPHLKSHGLYFIEDTHCGFEEKYGASVELYQWVFNMIIEQQTPKMNFGGNFYVAREHMPPIVKDIYSYSFYKSVVIFEKA